MIIALAMIAVAVVVFIFLVLVWFGVFGVSAWAGKKGGDETPPPTKHHFLKTIGKTVLMAAPLALLAL